MSAILFLDFDGVLHPTRGDVAPFEYAPLLVAALEPYPDVRIVLSTSWVEVFGLEESRAFLPEELRRRVMGATYYEEWPARLTRYGQIVHYVRRHLLTRWLALDDDDQGWPAEHRQRLVRTSGLLGLAHPDAVPELTDKLKRLTA